MDAKKSQPSLKAVVKNYLESSDKDVLDFIIDIWNNEIRIIAKNNEKEKYLYAIYLCFSLIEDLLRIIVWVKFALEIVSTGRDEKKNIIREKEYEKFIKYYQNFFREEKFYRLIKWGLALKVIESSLYKKLEKIRRERNELVHKLWLKLRRKNYRYLRRKLEFYGSVCYELINLSIKVVDIDEAWNSEVLEPLFFK